MDSRLLSYRERKQEFSARRRKTATVTAPEIILFEAAYSSMLSFDEIGSMDLGLQAKLLKAIEEKTVHRLGSIQSRRFDIVLIAATNQPP